MALRWRSVLHTFFSTYKQIKGQLNSTVPCPSSPSFWWHSHTFAFLSFSTESHFLPLPHCRVHIFITTISAICNFVLILHFVLSTPKRTREGVLVLPHSASNSQVTWWYRNKPLNHLPSNSMPLWEKKPQSADVSLKQAISRAKLMLTRRAAKWVDRRKIFCTLLLKFKLRSRHPVNCAQLSEGI